ncbi:MAG TPA: 2'-5' RNA ligase family protein [Stellaceae bacterium]|nr:2'-5' RNA ligase family protein [Stellaceae bacterium]
MALFVVAYPIIDATALERIEAVRRLHDPVGHAKIRPHVTLAFALHGVAPETVASAAREAAAGPIGIALRAVMAMPDLVAGGHLVYLVPDTGFAALVALHRRLHAGVLAPFRRLDIPFVPHITLSARLDAAPADKLAVDLAGAGLDCDGHIEQLTIVDLTGDKAINVGEIPLLRMTAI